jgi:serine/threonine protein kinase
MKCASWLLCGTPILSRFERRVAVFPSQHLSSPKVLGYSEKPPAIVLEHALYGSLDALLVAARPNSALPIEAAVLFAQQICSGMLYLHKRSILHRDLYVAFFCRVLHAHLQNALRKPCNVLLTHGLLVKLTDFGLARVRDATVMQTRALGTVVYMAPECFAGARCLFATLHSAD